ncbi:SWPV2-ORF186 [Shearwaterpox virus]|uniref:SWPV2-ORF186 n=1 Tax=Shearwaterpox virus TaxID=1974596 RepID=A0A1V0QGF1_CNPV|nr:SWPV2-ORF186 [Shearwaterpox virus]QRI42917.1 C-type lectin-like protein [Cheloniid poxvirus 1]QRM15474.1 C-type lectin-like protein [Mudlarkpox virus]QRM15829.1 c-type lectin-like protein [Penguinpox virus 2]QRM16164.1 c-type lectin-like protein [Albatrosspox virus]
MYIYKYIKIHTCISEVFIFVTALCSVIFLLQYIFDAKVCYKTDHCDKGWIGIGEKCYYYSNELANWTDSLKKCREVGADLVTYPSDPDTEYDVTRYSCFDKHWVGAYKINTNSQHPDKNDECYYVSRGMPTHKGDNVFLCNVTIHWICEKNMYLRC